VGEKRVKKCGKRGKRGGREGIRMTFFELGNGGMRVGGVGFRKGFLGEYKIDHEIRVL